MVDALSFEGNRIVITKNDKVTFDSAAKSIQLFPDSSKIVLANKAIEFPNLLQANAYHRYTGGGIGGGASYCESWGTVLRQEWGPAEANFNGTGYLANPLSTRNLAQEYLGSVPAETDYLDVRVRLVRTKVPAVMWNVSPPRVLFEEGGWLNLPGGSCPTEFFFPLIRHFDIVREGTAVYLRRYQSVADKGTVTAVMPSGGGIIDSDATVSGGWTCGSAGSAWVNMPDRAAWLAVLMQTKGPDVNGNKRRNGQNPCAVPGRDVPYPDLGAIYTGDIVIHPGRYT